MILNYIFAMSKIYDWYLHYPLHSTLDEKNKIINLNLLHKKKKEINNFKNIYIVKLERVSNICGIIFFGITNIKKGYIL